MSFEAQKIKFLGHFGRENLKMCEKFGAKIRKMTKNGAKILKMVSNLDFVMRQNLPIFSTVHFGLSSVNFVLLMGN